MPRDNTRPTAPAADGVGAPLLERRRSSGFASPSMERVGSHIGSPLLEKSEAEAQIEEIRRYEDFSTVDWIQDSLRERNLRAKGDTLPEITTTRTQLRTLNGLFFFLWRIASRAFAEGQSWVVVTLVGIGIGINAALISIVTAWLSDMKLGYCTTGWWLSQKFCCMEISDEGAGCQEWRNWGGIEPFRYIAYVLFAALFSVSAAHLVKTFAPYAAGSGISEIKCIIGGFIINGFLSPWTLLIKSLTMCLAIASGLQVGKEGPSVHVACCVGNVVSRFFRKYRDSHTKTREILTAASAAGVAVAFGSPIGGVLFAIEEMSHHFTNKMMWRSFVCALVATFTLSVMNPFRTGKLVLFQVSYDRDWHYFEIPFFVAIGIFGGLYGAFVIKFNLQVAAFRRKHLAAHGIYEAVTLAVCTAVVGYLNRFMRIDMTESLEILFKECEGGGNYEGLCQTSSRWRMVNSLLLATIIRTGFIIVSYGCKVPAGIFVPSMAVGATFGRMVGIVAKAIQASHPTSNYFAVCAPDAPCITPGTYALLGAAATLGGVTRITVTVVVIMFELTGALTYILPTMIVLLVTKAVSDFFGGGGIADRMIRFNGYPFLEKEDKEDGDHAYEQPIANAMKRDLTVIHADGMPLQEIEEILQSTDYRGFPVVRSEEDSTVLGFLQKTELRYALDKAKRSKTVSLHAVCTFQQLDASFKEPNTLAAPSRPTANRTLSNQGNADSSVRSDRIDLGQYVDQTSLSVSPALPMEIVMQMFRRMGPRVILVTKEGRLAGLVTVKDVLKHEASIEHSHRSSPTQSQTPLPLSTVNNGGSAAPAGTGDQDWRDRALHDEEPAGLEVVLEVMLERVQGIVGQAKSIAGGVLGSRLGNSAGSTDGADAAGVNTRFSTPRTPRDESQTFQLGEAEDYELRDRD